ncbi:MAG: ankyrin repeat domain-containing protein [Candidatus Omnitrophica bacterium]|nr:ankyrin repeat domain-containing protein [Candidatus Omnitrophota bacterium]
MNLGSKIISRGVLLTALVLAAGCCGHLPGAKKSAPEDVSVDFKHVVCQDDHQLFDCKPRLMHAIEIGDLGRVKKILANDVDVNIAYPYYYGKSALMQALDAGKEDIALYLLEQGADVQDVVPLDPLATAEARGLTRAAAVIRQKRQH